MTNELSKEKVLKLLEGLCLDMESCQDQLHELDAKTGDGDLGVTVKLGFSAVRNSLSKIGPEDIATVLIKSGVVFNNAAASTFGTLMATAFMRGGKAIKGKSAIDLNAISQMLLSAIEGIIERGGAAVGDCTMLDALVPAQKAIERCAQNNISMDCALSKAAEAAKKGTEATINMKAKHGRAGWLAEKTLGIPDAGATAIAIMLDFLSQRMKELD